MTVSRGFVPGQKAPQFHSDTNPPICNSVHSNKVTPTEANSLPLTGRRGKPHTNLKHTHLHKNSPVGSSPPSSASTAAVVARNFSHLFYCRLLRLSPQQTSSPSVCSQSPASLRAVKLAAATHGISGRRLQSKVDDPGSHLMSFGGLEVEAEQLRIMNGMHRTAVH